MYNYFLKNAFSTKNTSFTLRPDAPVWGVTRVFPNIFYEYYRTSDGFVAVWTPPFKFDYLKIPLPLPPACIWALMMISTKGLFLDVVAIILCAIEYASSGVLALKLCMNRCILGLTERHISWGFRMPDTNANRDYIDFFGSEV